MNKEKDKINPDLSEIAYEISHKIIILRDWVERQFYLEIGKDKGTSELYYPNAPYLQASHIKFDVTNRVLELGKKLDYSKKHNQKIIELIVELISTEDYLFNLELRANWHNEAQKTRKLIKKWRSHLDEQRKTLELLRGLNQMGVMKNAK